MAVRSDTGVRPLLFTQPRRLLSRNIWTVGVYALLAVMFVVTFSINPAFGAFDLISLALGALAPSFAAVAEALVVFAAGIDLSVGALISVGNVLSASWMMHASFGESLLLALAVLVVMAMAGFVDGLLVVLTKVPDIVVTLAMSFVWSGVALLILAQPGGGAPAGFVALATGTFLLPWIPTAFVILVAVVAIVWIPIRSHRVGLSIFAVGSDRQAAARSGVNVARGRLSAYTLGGFFAGAAGVALTMNTGTGDPLSGSAFTLTAVATIVLGGVNLLGGRGGLLGPIAGAYILELLATDLVFLGISPSYAEVIQGVVIVLIVMVGGLAALRQMRRAK